MPASTSARSDISGGRELGERLAARNLGLAGAYLELPYADHRALDAAMPALDDLLDTFEAVRPYRRGPAPRPTLADSGSEARRNQPGQAIRNRSLGLDADGWSRFGVGLERAVARCRDRGYEPTFHHETGTYVEAPWEIERVLELSDIGLCLDTGHLLLGGGDPVRALSDWGSRINQVHLKDARRSVMAGIVADGAPTAEIWTREAFPPLGGGDLDVDGVLDRPAGHGLQRLARRGTGHLPADQGALRARVARPAREPGVPRRTRAMSSAAFRLGLIGAGRMGQTHLRALASSERVAVTAIVEPLEALRASHAGSSIDLFESVDDLLAAGGIDGALVAAPSDRHVEIVTKLAAAGVPILCEKPCGLDSHDVRLARGRPRSTGFRSRSATGGATCRRSRHSGRASPAASSATST